MKTSLESRSRGRGHPLPAGVKRPNCNLDPNDIEKVEGAAKKASKRRGMEQLKLLQALQPHRDTKESHGAESEEGGPLARSSEHPSEGEGDEEAASRGTVITKRADQGGDEAGAEEEGNEGQLQQRVKDAVVGILGKRKAGASM